MAMRRPCVALALAILTRPAASQTKAGLAITPFVGLTVARADLLLKPGQIAGRDQLKQSVYGVVGGSIAVGLSPRFELAVDVGSGSSGLRITTLSSPSGTRASVLTTSARLAFRIHEPTAPLSLTVHAGPAAIRRSFSDEVNQSDSPIHDRTSFGAVIGGAIRFRISSRVGLSIGVDDFIYNASFAVAASGPLPAGQSPELTQNDIRLAIGIRWTLIGN
jgi:hypothetical protein